MLGWGLRMKANYAIKPTPEQALGTDRAARPARLIAALDFGACAVAVSW